MKKLTHIDPQGKASMVDVSGKEISKRTASAFARIKVSELVFDQIISNQIAKGDVLAVANIAGIHSAKKTSELIPLCHNIFISEIKIDFNLVQQDNTIEITSYASTNSVTGIEMEALTAASIAALTIYDMCKAMDKSIIISEIKLLSKTGGKSGSYSR